MITNKLNKRIFRSTLGAVIIVIIVQLILYWADKKCPIRLQSFYNQYVLGNKYDFETRNTKFKIPQDWLINFQIKREKSFIIANHCNPKGGVSFSVLALKNTNDFIQKLQYNRSYTKKYDYIKANQLKIFLYKTGKKDTLFAVIPAKDLGIFIKDISFISSDLLELVKLNEGTDIDFILTAIIKFYKEPLGFVVNSNDKKNRSL